MFQTSVLVGFCSDPRANKRHFLLLEDREEQTSAVQQDLGECLLVVGLQDESSQPTFEYLHQGGPGWLAWMSAALESLKLGAGDLLVSVPQAIPLAFYH